MVDVSSACNALANGDFSVNALDLVVSAAYDPRDCNRALANTTLMRLQESPYLWTKAGEIIEQSRIDQSRFFALQILEGAIKTRWKILPDEERLGIRNFVVSKIIGISQDEHSLRTERVYIRKLNLTLVEILKQEWPHHWPTFIPDLVGASKASEVLCENNMHILKLFSEEVFDFSKDQMVTEKVKRMKETLSNEFSQIFSLCQFVLENSQRPSLLTETLRTMQRFLTWIPLEYIFQTNVIELLVDKFFTTPLFRNDALDCLTVIGNLKNLDHQYDAAFQSLFGGFISRLAEIFSPDTNLQQSFEAGSEDDQLFIQKLALFLSGFFMSHLTTLEAPNSHPSLLAGLTYLVRVSETQVFRICLDAWHMLAKDLCVKGQGDSKTSIVAQRRLLYSPVIQGVRHAMIMNMAKPEEVLIVEDENGDIVRETTKNTAVLAQYKAMRETLKYLTSLSCAETTKIMLAKLSEEVEKTSWSWNGLNTVCWAIGSISGSMGAFEESQFVVAVLKILLNLIERVRGKDNRAVVAANIMYVVGQYPRFLRANWKFLKTVVKKLFEFMQDPFPGVQDMACDTFLKITTKCKRSFAVAQGSDPPYVYELVATLSHTVSELEPHQVQRFYEAIAMILSDNGPPGGKPEIDRKQMLLRLMEPLNEVWAAIMATANLNLESLVESSTVAHVIKILKTNNRVCTAVGSLFTHQLKVSLMDLLNVYKAYSMHISGAIAHHGPIATQMSLIRTLRTAKKEILRLLIVYVEKSSPPEADLQSLASSFAPPVLENLLPDYNQSIAVARDSEVLTLMTAMVEKLQGAMSCEIPRIMEAVFEVTLEMVSKNFEDFPEHRSTLFELLHAVNHYSFESLFSLRAEQQSLILKAIIWAIQHTERNISDTGLQILHDLLSNVEKNPEGAQGFYQQHYLSLLQEILALLTDRLHTSGFNMHATILFQLLQLVQTSKLTVPLFDQTSFPPGTTNQSFLYNHLSQLLLKSFPNLSSTVVTMFMDEVFGSHLKMNKFKTLLRDFLIILKEISVEEKPALFTEEKGGSVADARR